ncbi:MAG: hypothetical protein WB611_21760 [Stellaceae bacterium]
MPSILERTTIEWTLGDDDMRVGYIGDCIVVMRAFELPPDDPGDPDESDC